MAFFTYVLLPAFIGLLILVPIVAIFFKRIHIWWSTSTQRHYKTSPFFSPEFPVVGVSVITIISFIIFVIILPSKYEFLSSFTLLIGILFHIYWTLLQLHLYGDKKTTENNELNNENNNNIRSIPLSFVNELPQND